MSQNYTDCPLRKFPKVTYKVDDTNLTMLQLTAHDINVTMLHLTVNDINVTMLQLTVNDMNVIMLHITLKTYILMLQMKL